MNAKKAGKKGKALHAGKRLEEQKPLKNIGIRVTKTVDKSSPNLFLS